MTYLGTPSQESEAQHGAIVSPVVAKVERLGESVSPHGEDDDTQELRRGEVRTAESQSGGLHLEKCSQPPVEKSRGRLGLQLFPLSHTDGSGWRGRSGGGD